MFTLVSRILYVYQVYTYKINNVKKNDFLLLGYLNYFSVRHLFYQLPSALIEPKTFLSMRTQMQALLPLCLESNTLPILTPLFVFHFTSLYSVSFFVFMIRKICRQQAIVTTTPSNYCRMLYGTILTVNH